MKKKFGSSVVLLVLMVTCIVGFFESSYLGVYCLGAFCSILMWIILYCSQNKINNDLYRAKTNKINKYMILSFIIFLVGVANAIFSFTLINFFNDFFVLVWFILFIVSSVYTLFSVIFPLKGIFGIFRVLLGYESNASFSLYKTDKYFLISMILSCPAHIVFILHVLLM